MKYHEKADYINNMPYEMFKELLSDSNSTAVALNRSNEIMKVANNQRPNDNRGNAKASLNRDYIIICIDNHESMLATKMVSLEILFANPTDDPNYFKSMCETFSYEDRQSGDKVIDYKHIANMYGTTSDNVKSNILYTTVKEQLNELSNTYTK